LYRQVAATPVVKPVLTAAVVNAVMAMPAEAAGKLFDFNLTMPVMAGQFLLLMVFLDKTWFTPVGKVLDERDELIRSKLAAVQGDSSSIADMQEEAERIVKEARAEANAAVNEAKSSTQAEQDAKLQTLKEVRSFGLSLSSQLPVREGLCPLTVSCMLSVLRPAQDPCPFFSCMPCFGGARCQDAVMASVHSFSTLLSQRITGSW
jgi:hypothetical protein